jgi:hypothetical protein
MTTLVAILWTIYVSECFVRVRPGDWLFRRGLSGTVRGVGEPDAQFLGGSLAFSWTSLLPWRAVYVVSGARLESRALDDRLIQTGRARRLVAAAASALFVLVLIVFPALAMTNRLLPVLPWFVPTVALLWLATFVAFLRTYRRARGTRPPIEVWLTHALSPLSLIRSPAVATLPALADVHPVAAASALCDADEFLRIARLWHYDAEGDRLPIERLARARGLLAALTAPPAAADGATFFCPRCHATYLAQRTDCRDCDDVPLRALTTAPAS